MRKTATDWNVYVIPMKRSRLPKIARDNKPNSRTPPDGSTKRWAESWVFRFSGNPGFRRKN